MKKRKRNADSKDHTRHHHSDTDTSGSLGRHNHDSKQFFSPKYLTSHTLFGLEVGLECVFPLSCDGGPHTFSPLVVKRPKLSSPDTLTTLHSTALLTRLLPKDQGHRNEICNRNSAESPKSKDDPIISTYLDSRAGVLRWMDCFVRDMSD